MKIFSDKRFVMFVAILLSVVMAVYGQKYCYPIKGVKGLYSASFGEMRPNHFHSGIDIRTEGAEGKAVVAVADGYVSSIALAPNGYGLALYVTHPDKGTMSVYAHLSRLRKDIAEYLVAERYRRKQNRLRLFPQKEMFVVAQGDTIAYSGNSGSSFGPHLHFELRDVASGHTLNPVRQGVVAPRDTIAPDILRLHYVAIEKAGEGERSCLKESYTPRFDGEKYVVSEIVEVGEKGYFVVETKDRRNGSTNRFGVYRATMSIDEEPRFEYRIDHFAFVDTRHCNVASFYPLQHNAKCEVIRLARMPYAPEYLYNNAFGDGVVRSKVGEQRSVEVFVDDECGNTSKLSFEMCGATPTATAVAPTVENSLLDGKQAQSIEAEGLSLFVPRGALYEVEPYEVSIVENITPIDTTLVQLSPIFRIFTEDTPFNKAVRIRFAIAESAPYANRACVATIDEEGEMKYLGGEYRGDSVEVVARRGGGMVVVADTIAPMIRPRFKARADMRGVKQLSFSVKDNFSKVRNYTLYIDGEWRSVDYQPIKGEMVHRFDMPLQGRGVWHNVRLEVEDCCGNIGVWQGKILK